MIDFLFHTILTDLCQNTLYDLSFGIKMLSKVLRFLTKAIYFEFHYPLTLALLTMLSGVISHLYYMQTDDLIQTETFGNYEFLSCATKQLSKCEVLAKSEIFVFPFAKSQIIMLSFAKAKDFSRNVKYDS
ncbi:hypothetical protein T12_2821 [Trichinella patagoniensis]|uniref:Uncharacterized protein n=1 Tax=Trichinella patagoniensis TaxID=990121 RepID=A0A0V1A515_9BILA|nr:hypothetical protein T12_2821 [Trichinella patagoniensis]